MPTDHSTYPFDANKSREQLIQELAGLRTKLAAEEQHGRELSQELTRLQFLELPETERLFRAAMEHLPSVFKIYDTERRLQYVNAAAVRISGLRAEQLIGRRDEELIPPEVCDQYLPALKRVYETRQPQSLELNLPERFGGVIQIVQYVPVLDEYGQIRQVLAITTDITESKRVEEELRHSRRLLSEAASLSHTGAWEWDLVTGRWTLCDEWLAIHGCRKRTLTLEELLSIALSEDRAAVALALEDLRNGANTYEMEHRIVRQGDGAVRVVRARGRFVRDSEGTVVKAYGFAQDVTDRRDSEEALRQSEQRYRTLFETMTEGFALHEIITDEQGRPCDYRFLDVNPAFERLTGLKRRNLIGKRLQEVLPGTESHWIDSYGRVALTGVPLHMENYSSELGRWYEVFAYRTAPRQFAVVFTDNTQHKAAEQQLEQENREIALINRILRVFVEVSGDEMFEQVLDIVQEGLASRHGVFGYIAEPGHLICPSLSKMLDQCEVAGKCIHYPPEKWKGLWARALREKRSFYTNEPSWVPAGHPAIHNNLAAPILFQGDVIGLLNLANKESDYTETDRALLETMAERIAPLLYAWIQKRLREDERAKAEEELRQSRKDLDRAQEVGQIGSWRIDVTRNVLTWSDQNHRIFGVPERTPLTYEMFLAIVHPDDREYVDTQWKAGLRGHPYDIEHRIIVAGEVRWVREKAYLEFDEAGKLLGGFGISQDITERKRTEETLRESEQRVRRKLESVLSPEGDLGVLELADLIDIPAIRKLMDDFYSVARIPMSMLDVKGRVLVGVGWQDICTRFHRVQADTSRHCLESDTRLAAGLAQGECRLYKCRNNLWDMATPIIVAGQHVGNIFTGQFFFEDETVDRELFRAQARKYRFDEEDYLTAIDRVPRLSRETVDRGMAFFRKLADTLSQLGYSNVKLARLVAERDRLTDSLRESEERLRASLGEKEVLLKEIHHRVKNNMQVISSLVALQSNELQDAAMRAVLVDVTHRVRSMAMVHEKLYESPDLARVEFAEYTRSLLNYLWHAHSSAASGVRLALDLEPVSLSVNAAVPCGLILNELVGNALKHAFRDRAGGEVTVSLRGGAQGGVRLCVRDNGTGLPERFDWRQARSLGLRLVQMLTGQLHAAVEASSDGGTAFTITFGGPKT